MWHKTVSRQQFVEAVGNLDKYQELPFSLESGDPEMPQGDRFTAVWIREHRPQESLPDLLIFPRERINDFLAFGAAFLGSLRPLSAHVRLITTDQFKSIVYPSTNTGCRIGREALIGAVIAEVLTEVKTKSAFESIAMNAFTSTYSYSMARSLWLYRDDQLLEDTSRFWFSVREWTHQPLRRLRKTDLLEVWDILRSFVTEKSNHNREAGIVVDALRELYEHKSLSTPTLRSITGGKMGTSDIDDLMSTPREDRLRFVEAFLGAGHNRISLIDDFLCGFFMSLISNGTLDYASLLLERLERFPTSLMWYGICCGVKREGRLDTWRRGLQQWLTREIERDFSLSERPRTDVSAVEFQILLRAPSKGGLLQDNARTLAIELVPGVEQTLPWPPRSEENKEINLNNENMKKTIEDVQAISQRCESILKRLEPTTKQVESEPAQMKLGIDSPLDTADNLKKDRSKKKGRR